MDKDEVHGVELGGNMRLKLTGSQKLRFFHAVNHVIAIFGLILYSPLWLILSFFIWSIVGSFGISIGFHRLLSHRSFKTSRWIENAFATIGCLATGGSPIAWAGSHRLHHLYADTELDPHAWQFIGKWRVYNHLWNHFVIPRSQVRDLLKNRYLKFLHRHYFKLLVLWALALFAINPVLGIFGYCWPAVFAYHAFGLINLFGHLHGYKTFSKTGSATNSWIANLLTCGEGWHDNHHRFPSLYRIGLKRWELDYSARLLEVLPVMSDVDVQLRKSAEAMSIANQNPTG